MDMVVLYAIGLGFTAVGAGAVAATVAMMRRPTRTEIQGMLNVMENRITQRFDPLAEDIADIRERLARMETLLRAPRAR